MCFSNMGFCEEQKMSEIRLKSELAQNPWNTQEYSSRGKKEDLTLYVKQKMYLKE